MRGSTLVCIGLFLAVTFHIPAGAAEVSSLRAGVAKTDITPRGGGVYLGGYDSRTSPAVGVHDPLFARALVLDCDGRRMAIVSLDLIWFPSERVAREAQEKYAVGLVLTAASHSHATPDLLYSQHLWKPDRFQEVFREIEDKILAAIGQASAGLFRARLSTARGDITLGYNRLVMQPDGRRKPLFRNPERIPYGPVDPTVGIIRVEDADAGTTRAVLVNYACHPVCLGPRNLEMSADYVGPMADKVEKGIKPQAFCLFMQGAGSNINPLFVGTGAKDETNEDCFRRAKVMGELLADEVLRALTHARPVGGPDELQWRRRTMTFANRWKEPGSEYYMPAGPIEIGAASVLINRRIGIMAIPGEPHLSLQMMFKRDAPVEFPLFLGYTTCGHPKWPEYIPDIRAAAEGGYGAARRTFIEVGGGERLVNQALIDLYDMKGMFSDKPEK
ncbi:MAG: neutral/alkaline non-lysosomal ceramidase N-terminal domain-containing protein [Candidatus Sumerlaeia bacterium]|nr:neutral/alkaline non-lysosomal ceramidase N-terminal domain-containing protein [Candidatus Sumerlaeia bacterium]